MRGFRLGAVLLAAGLVALCSLAAVGSLIGDDKKADPKDPEPKARGILPKYYKQLGVTEDQRQAIYKIENSYTAKIDALQKQIKDLKAEEVVAIEKVLTKAQLDRLQELRNGDKDKDAKDKDTKDKDTKDKDAKDKDTKDKDAKDKDKDKKDNN